jgi:hypothetical protein
MRARLLAMAVLTSILAAGTVRAEPTADASAPTVITPAPTAPAATAQVPATPAASLPAAKAACRHPPAPLPPFGSTPRPPASLPTRRSCWKPAAAAW